MYLAIKVRSKFHNDFPENDELFSLIWQNKFVLVQLAFFGRKGTEENRLNLSLEAQIVD